MEKRWIHRKFRTALRVYLCEGVDVGGAAHFELSVMDMTQKGAVVERIVFNTKREADSGMLDRICTK